MSLATDLRPTSLDQVIGQEMTVRAVKRLFESGGVIPIPCVLLFSGPPGVGKTTIAKILAGMAKAEVIELNASDKSGVDDMRQLVERIGYRPLTAPFRVILMDEVQRLTPDAQNVLLKPTEDDNPKNATLWFFCTTNPSKLIKPLRDRCIEFQLNPLAKADAAELVERAIKKLDANNSGVLARTRMIGVDLIGEIYHTRAFEAPRVILNTLEKVLAGVPLSEAVQEVDSEPEFIDIARRVSQGDWPGTAKLLKEFKGTDIQAIARVTKGYLKTILLNNLVSTQTDALSEVILIIGQYTGVTADTADLSAVLYRACKKIKGLK